MRCIDCQCNPFGSENIQCDPNGKCRCKPGVVGDKCDRCAPYHYELSVTGCKICTCNPIGSFDNPPICDPRDGNCRCKTNVEGQNCDRPKPGFFNLDVENPNGALSCFCYGHSSICNSSSSYSSHAIRAQFDDHTKWQAVDSYGHPVKTDLEYDDHVSVSIQSSHDDVWILAPSQFIGNQLHSYSQDLSFELRIVDHNHQQSYVQSVRPSRKDIVLQSAQYNLEVYSPIYGANSGSGGRNQLPSSEPQTFTFKLDQYSGWMPTLTSHDFQRLLTNLSSIKIRASYVPSSRAVLTAIKLNSAKKLVFFQLIFFVFISTSSKIV
jgi:laminin gamma 1